MDTFQFEGKTYERVAAVEKGTCRGCAFKTRECGEAAIPGRPDCTEAVFVEAEIQAPAAQPAVSGLTRLVALREKAVHTLEETALNDPQVAFWGVSITGVPMVRLDTLADAQQVQRLADAAFQAGRQKAFSDLLGFVEGQR